MKKVVVNNKMQKGYTYILSEPEGKNFAKDFRPELTPKQMLAVGVFGGVYMRDAKKEYPKNWFTKAKFAPENTDKTRKHYHDPQINHFKVNASQPLSVWREKGWISEYDPRGWFEWYCRYYMGRRIPDEDTRQINRWKKMVRHVGQIRVNCKTGDELCRPRQRQALLHWAYDSRKA
jgi:hypothetical protein